MANLPPVRPRQNVGIARDGSDVAMAGPFARWLDAVRIKVDALNKQAVPTGAIQSTLATTEPSDGEWLFCNGQAVAKSSYPDLYAIVGDTFGATALSFNLPDLTDRFLVGAGDIALKGTGGADEVTLTTAELPAHSHGVTDAGHGHTFTGTPHSHTVTDPGHTHTSGTVGANSAATGSDVAIPAAGSTGSATTGLTVDNATAGGTISSDTTGVTVDSAGSGDAFSITPPAVGVNWLIKT